MQIGYVNKLKFKPLPNKNKGVGDDNYSYEFDGSRANEWGKSYQYFKKDINIKNNDNIGCLIDLNKKEIKYYLKILMFLVLNQEYHYHIQQIKEKLYNYYFPKNYLPYDSGINFRTKDVCIKKTIKLV